MSTREDYIEGINLGKRFFNSYGSKILPSIEQFDIGHIFPGGWIGAYQHVKRNSKPSNSSVYD